jgi:shikimate dehydrogenase
VTTATTTRRAAVLGSPIAHSLSPVLHRAAYDALGLTGWTYEAYDVTEDRLGDFLSGLDAGWAGLSLTMPLKAAVIPFLDAAAPVVEAVGAANTVVLTDGRRLGENTDVPGMVAALAEHGVQRVDRAAVLGGGATARSAVAALAAVTGSATAYLRSAGRADALLATAAAVGVDLDVRPWSAAGEAFDAPLVARCRLGRQARAGGRRAGPAGPPGGPPGRADDRRGGGGSRLRGPAPGGGGAGAAHHLIPAQALRRFRRWPW